MSAPNVPPQVVVDALTLRRAKRAEFLALAEVAHAAQAALRHATSAMCIVATPGHEEHALLEQLHRATQEVAERQTRGMRTLRTVCAAADAFDAAALRGVTS